MQAASTSLPRSSSRAPILGTSALFGYPEHVVGCRPCYYSSSKDAEYRCGHGVCELPTDIGGEHS
jgi:hypothetical protein